MANSWLQLGQDIDGEAAFDESGDTVSLSSDGLRVAIGSHWNSNDAGSSAGLVRVYEYGSGFWIQQGQDIVGESAADLSGWSVSISSNGSRVAIGAVWNDNNCGTSAGHVRVYEFDYYQWTQLGQDIDGETAYDESGDFVCISGDGSTVAIGAQLNDDAGSNAGHVRVYKYINNLWSKQGQDIDGEDYLDYSGVAISLSTDGNRVAIGAYGNDNSSGINAGHVRVYEFDYYLWNQLGQDINGEAAHDISGQAVSLSSDGSKVAIGAYNNDNNAGIDAGHVRVYEFDNNLWAQLGQDIDGEAASDKSGFSVSLSSDGMRVATSALHNDGAGLNSGHVRVYELINNLWAQVGGDIDGEAAYDFSGSSISLSGDGSRVAIGAYWNDGGGINSGHVRVYEEGISTPSCENSPLSFPLYGYTFDCDLVDEYSLTFLCDQTEIPSHCPVTCDTCDEFACSDSDIDFNLNGNTLSCAILVIQPPSTISLACGFPDIEITCRDTCGVC